jgi:hypothetical protein
MSRAQKLLNRAIEVLTRRSNNELNDQKALAEIRGLVERTDDDGVGTASEKLKLVRRALQAHHNFVLNDSQAMAELYALCGLKA